MEFKYFSRNGESRPIDEATISLSNIEYQYGFGVYETIRVLNGISYFLDQHVKRLIESARIIALEHSFSADTVARAVAELVEKTGAGAYNLKILLIGGTTPELDILPLNPHFPEKKMYRDGVHCITHAYERPRPHAKSLNMLDSYLAYKRAQDARAYDALFLDRMRNISEGTRSNFFCMRGRILFTPPEEKVLLGVTRAIVMRLAEEKGFGIEQRNIAAVDLDQYEAAFLTSTSSGIMPIASVDGFRFGARPRELMELMDTLDAFLESCGGKF